MMLIQSNYPTKGGTKVSKEWLILRIKTWVPNWIPTSLAGSTALFSTLDLLSYLFLATGIERGIHETQVLKCQPSVTLEYTNQNMNKPWLKLCFVINQAYNTRPNTINSITNLTPYSVKCTSLHPDWLKFLQLCPAWRIWTVIGPTDIWRSILMRHYID